MRAIQEYKWFANQSHNACRDVRSTEQQVANLEQALASAKDTLACQQSHQLLAVSAEQKQGQLISRLQVQQRVGWPVMLPREVSCGILSKTSRYHAKMCAVSSLRLQGLVLSAEPIKFESKWGRQRLAANRHHSLAVTADGSLFSWGDGEDGKLGVGDEDMRIVPTLVQGELKGKTVAQVSAGEQHSACVTADGELYAWGYLSNGYTVVLPTLVRGPLQGTVVTQVSASGSGCCTLCVTVEGAVYSWGRGDFGQLGLGDTQDRQLPTLVQGQLQGKVVAQVSAGCFSGYCATTYGAVFSWGIGSNGGLGLGDQNDRHVPTQIERLRGESVVQIAASDHALAVTVDGSLFSWGSNDCGQLGLGDTDIRLFPTPVCGDLHVEAVRRPKLNCHTELVVYRRLRPVQVKDVVQVSVCGSSTACVTEAGAVFAWGAVDFQSMDVLEPAGRVLAPTQVDEDDDWTREDGNPIVQGRDEDVLEDQEELPFLAGGDMSGMQVAQVAAGGSHMLCVTINGEIFSWGLNDDGCGHIGCLGIGLGAWEQDDWPMPVLVGKDLQGRQMI